MTSRSNMDKIVKIGAGKAQSAFLTEGGNIWATGHVDFSGVGTDSGRALGRFCQWRNMHIIGTSLDEDFPLEISTQSLCSCRLCSRKISSWVRDEHDLHVQEMPINTSFTDLAVGNTFIAGLAVEGYVISSKTSAKIYNLTRSSGKRAMRPMIMCTDKTIKCQFTNQDGIVLWSEARQQIPESRSTIVSIYAGYSSDILLYGIYDDSARVVQIDNPFKIKDYIPYLKISSCRKGELFVGRVNPPNINLGYQNTKGISLTCKSLKYLQIDGSVLDQRVCTSMDEPVPFQAIESTFCKNISEILVSDEAYMLFVLVGLMKENNDTLASIVMCQTDLSKMVFRFMQQSTEKFVLGDLLYKNLMNGKSE